MEKQPFTPAGILALQHWLYQLPPHQFSAEIAAMETDFEGWSLEHLELDAHQLIFYKQLSALARNNLAYVITLAAKFKKRISLVHVFQKNNDSEPVEDKLFKPKNTLAVTSDNQGNDVVEGEVEIEVSYLN